MITPLGLQQHDPGRGSHKQRRPEGDQYKDQKQVAKTRGRVRDQVRDRVTEQQTQRRDAQAHPESPPQQRKVDAAFFGLTPNGAIRPPLQIQGVEIVPCRKSLPGAADRVPCPGVTPGGVNAYHGVPPGSAVDSPEAPRALRQHASQPALDPVDAAGDLTEGTILARLHEFTRGGFVDRLVRSTLAVPFV